MGKPDTLADPDRLAALRATLLLDLEADEDLDRIARVARRVLTSRAAAITLLDDERQWVKSVATADKVAPYATPVGEAGCQHVVRGGRPVAVDDTVSAYGWSDLPSVVRGEVGAYLGVPLRTSDGHVLGALCATEARPRAWTVDDGEVLTALAETAMRVVEGRAARLRAEAGEARVRAVADALPGGAVVVLDRDLRYVLAHGPAYRRSLRLGLPGILGQRAADVVDPVNWPRHAAAYAAALDGDESTFVAERDARHYRVSVAPLRERGEDDVDIDHIVVTVLDVSELVAAERAARDLALRDEMTGAYSRRGFLEVCRPSLAQAARSGRQALVFFADCDGLKAVNDTHGHAAGDDMIRAAVGVLRVSLRDSDVVGRLGGDELVAYVPDMVAETVPALRARIRANVAAYNATSAHPWRLAMSVGHAVYDPRAGQTLEQLLEISDAEMYRRKSNRKATGSSSDAMPAVRP